MSTIYSQCQDTSNFYFIHACDKKQLKTVHLTKPVRLQSIKSNSLIGVMTSRLTTLSNATQSTLTARALLNRTNHINCRNCCTTHENIGNFVLRNHRLLIMAPKTCCNQSYFACSTLWISWDTRGHATPRIQT